MPPTIPPIVESLFGPVFSNPSALAPWILSGVVVLWILFTLIIIYHWVRYSLHPSRTLFFLALYAVVSLGLLGFAASGLPQ